MNPHYFNQPIKLHPYLKETPWAGQKLSSRYGGAGIGEAYLLSARQGAESRLPGGLPFSVYLSQNGRDPRCFPLLIKAIDAAAPLSVQVHPDDVFASACEAEAGKNELWYIDRCTSDAALFIGFRQDVSVAEVVRRCADGSILSLLNRIPVQEGELFFVPAGTVHAIGGGVSLFEIQQNSDLTYRLYDYGRGRPLQLERALSVLDLKGTVPENYRLAEECLCGEEGRIPFAVDCCCFKADCCCRPPRDSALVFLSGAGCFECNGVDFGEGDCFFVPKDCCCTLLGHGKVLRVDCGD